MRCPHCGKEIDKVTVLVRLDSSEKQSYKCVGGKVFEYDDILDTETLDERVVNVECPQCGHQLEWKRIAGEQLELV